MEVVIGIVATIFFATILVIPCVLVSAIWMETMTPFLIKIVWTDLIVMFTSGFAAWVLMDL